MNSIYDIRNSTLNTKMANSIGPCPVSCHDEQMEENICDFSRIRYTAASMFLERLYRKWNIYSLMKTKLLYFYSLFCFNMVSNPLFVIFATQENGFVAV